MQENERFTSLGDRMKGYENQSRNYHLSKIPLILRIDGKAFHSFTRGLNRPFDQSLLECMRFATLELAKEISGCKFAYTQSDEASFLITDWESDNTEGWFKYNKSKIESVAASMFTLFFNECRQRVLPDFDRRAFFDARTFSLPKEEVINYFLWRQWDCTRNAIQMVARANFTHKECENKNTSELQEMLFAEKGINFNNTPTEYKRGVGFYKKLSSTPNEYFGKFKGQTETVIRKYWITDTELPIFSKNKDWLLEITSLTDSINIEKYIESFKEA